jgi:hypothetical protein
MADDSWSTTAIMPALPLRTTAFMRALPLSKGFDTALPVVFSDFKPENPPLECHRLHAGDLARSC